MKLDEIDEMIIAEMKMNKRLKLKELSKSLDLPISTVHYRLSRLKKAGILNNTIEIDWKSLGYKNVVLLYVKTDKNINIKTIKQYPFVESVYNIIDDYNLLIIIRAKDLEHVKSNVERIRNILPNHSLRLVIADE